MRHRGWIVVWTVVRRSLIIQCNIHAKAGSSPFFKVFFQDSFRVLRFPSIEATERINVKEPTTTTATGIGIGIGCLRRLVSEKRGSLPHLWGRWMKDFRIAQRLSEDAVLS